MDKDGLLFVILNLGISIFVPLVSVLAAQRLSERATRKRDIRDALARLSRYSAEYIDAIGSYHGKKLAKMPAPYGSTPYAQQWQTDFSQARQNLDRLFNQFSHEIELLEFVFGGESVSKPLSSAALKVLNRCIEADPKDFDECKALMRELTAIRAELVAAIHTIWESVG